jgi:hypothetical protein
MPLPVHVEADTTLIPASSSARSPSTASRQELGLVQHHYLSAIEDLGRHWLW